MINLSTTDIAYCPDGNIYLLINYTLLNVGSRRSIARIDKVTGKIDVLTSGLAHPQNSLTCTSDNVLISAGSARIYTYDLKTGVLTDLGPMPPGMQMGGDLTFRNGRLYAALRGRRIAEIFIDSVQKSKVLFDLVLTSDKAEDLWGITSIPIACDSVLTYGFAVPNVTSLYPTSIYLIDFDTYVAQKICELPFTILGAASTTEFLSSDCSVRIDLDADNSSGATGKDYNALPFCGGAKTVFVADGDASYYSGYRTDSIRVRLVGSAVDAPFEYLSVISIGSVTVSGNNTERLILKSSGNALLTMVNADYEAVLHTLRWHNTAAVPTPGQRVIEVIAYAANGLTDTAYTYLSVEASAQAGRDTSVVMCADAAPVSLATLLGAQASPGGVWTPAPSGGSGVFVPQVDAPGIYRYIVGGSPGCPADTAEVLVLVQPLPVFSLGNDTSICAGKSLTLQTPTIAHWHDGTLAPTYNATQSGLYWAEITDPHGCRWRDSIRIEVMPAPTFQQTTSACQGTTYVWNGLSLNTDTTLCLTLKAANGCDSIACLSLTFHTATLALDTTLCSGKALLWHGRLYDAPGLYQDTAHINGCLTVLQLRLQMLPPDTVSRQATLCPGETYSLGGQTFSTPGQYFVPLPGQHLRCDTVVALRLEAKTLLQLQREATLCPGGTYAFGQRLLSAPGTYRDTFGCDSIVVLTLTQRTPPTVNISGQQHLCAGQKATLNAEGPYTSWRWSNGAQTPTIQTGGGTYRLTVADAFGCTATDSVNIKEAPPLQAQWSLTPPTCSDPLGGILHINATTGGFGGYQYDIGLGQWPSIGQFSGLAAGTYRLQVRDSLGCTANYEINLPPAPSLSLDLGPGVTLDPGQPYAIPVSIQPSGMYTYVWQPTTGLSCANCPNPVARPQETTTYWLRIQDDQGCWAEDSVLLRVRATEAAVYAPNVFSPNGDGHNDYFTLFARTDHVALIERLQVFDRWGNLVFDGQNLPISHEPAGWNGSWRGRELPPAVYTWHAQLQLNDGTLQRLAGAVTLVR